ncbi:MAG: lipoyl(octanoyl) transferase LipB [Alphaproteobacteria bacterium]|nr:lipoyl(octanoyl) transferase LipB [Alphaproteobacteria bacterium]
MLTPDKGTDENIIDWKVSTTPVNYSDALKEMETRADMIAKNQARELIWLLEHPPIYTAGTSAKSSDLLTPHRFPVYKTGRGGQYTYHGPGQRIAYLMLNLNRRQRDIRLFVAMLEEWLIATLENFNIKGETRNDRIGIWVRRHEKGQETEDKIASLGIRVRQWVTQHGVSLNIDPDLSHFDGIIPCGIQNHAVTSLMDLGVNASTEDVDKALRKQFELRFGTTRIRPILTGKTPIDTSSVNGEK